MPTGAAGRNLREFFTGLMYREDQRKPPDARRRGQFRRGWNRATSGTPMSQRTLEARLTWNNLGYRAGMVFGPAPDTTIHDAFEVFARDYQREGT